MQVARGALHIPSSPIDLRTPRKYVFDVTSVCQRSSPWTCNSVKVEIKFHLDCKLHFPSAQLMLRQLYLTKVFESIEAKYWVSGLSFDVNEREHELSKLTLYSSLFAVTADSKSKWPEGKKRVFPRRLTFSGYESARAARSRYIL